MRKLGIVGGIGPESTIDYYRMYVKEYQAKIQDGSYPELIINTIDMTKMLGFVRDEKWQELITYLADAVNNLAIAGAQFAIMASNTPHVVFEEVQSIAKIPLISIIEETCKLTKSQGISRVGLLGTSFTMKADYYQKVFNREGIEVFVPSKDEQEFIHHKIFSELQQMIIKEETKQDLLHIIKRMIDDLGIEGVILGCTELPLILTEDTLGIKFINTSKVHVDSAIKHSLFDKEE